MYAFASDARQITMQPPAAGPLIHELEHADGERGGDGGVDRVAAGFEHGGAGFGGAAMLRGYDAAARGDDGFADDLRV